MSAAVIKIVKRKRVDTICLDRSIEGFKVPPFQREVKSNSKLSQVAAEISETGVFPGILTIGIMAGIMYVVDGQHRLHAVQMSGRQDVLADVHYIEFDSMADMADEYVRLNSSIVKFGPDDILKGMEKSCAPMAYVRVQCKFVGFGQIRRNEASPIVSMSRLLRAWSGGSSDVPTGGHGSAAHLGESLTQESAENLVQFLKLAESAWGRDSCNARLWGGLNMVMCIWLWQHAVDQRSAVKRANLTRDMFKKGLLSLSANTDYVDWLVGRNINERDRVPAYTRIKQTIQARLLKDTGEKVMLPSPPWAHK